MRRVFDFLFALPDACSGMSFHELMLTGALLTLVVAVILTLSGRRLA
jgi:hypothetical protein